MKISIKTEYIISLNTPWRVDQTKRYHLFQSVYFSLRFFFCSVLHPQYFIYILGETRPIILLTPVQQMENSELYAHCVPAVALNLISGRSKNILSYFSNGTYRPGLIISRLPLKFTNNVCCDKKNECP